MPCGGKGLWARVEPSRNVARELRGAICDWGVTGAFGLDLYSGKCLDRTSSLGPWIVTRDEFAQRLPDLAMQLTVDEEIRQRDRTISMHWNLEELLSYVDARTRVLPGDMIFTGTPAGVGVSSGRFLEPGNVVAATIENIGTLRNKVGARSPAI